jgi:hypothetical protein
MVRKDKVISYLFDLICSTKRNKNWMLYKEMGKLSLCNATVIYFNDK